MSENTYTLFRTRKDINKSNYIDIDFEGGGNVSGYLLEPLDISSDAKYETFFNLDGKLGLLGEIAGFAAGVQIGKAGFWTKQYYRGGSYITIDGKIRVVNWKEGSDNVLRAVKIFISRCMPTESITKEQAAGTIQTLSNKVVAETETKKNEQQIEDENKNNTIKSAKQLASQAYQATQGVFKGIFSDLVSGSPKTATITTNYMSLPDMVLKSTTATYSKEMMENGSPLYADISFTFMQREIKQQSEVRNMIGKYKPTVRVTG